MLYSFDLLSELVDLEGITPAELAQKLTFASFEVDACHTLASASKLVIGHVLTCVKHPDSDHLHVLKVQAGPEGVLDIVCGAPNVAAGENVIVALPGCQLPAIGETIKASSIRGCPSNGMCCSLSELGVEKAGQSEEDLNGIHILPEEAPVGSYEVLKYLGLDDTVFEIDILPNRPDCLSHLGMAREIGAILGRKLKFTLDPELPHGKASVSVSSLTSSCDKFLLAEVKGLQGGKTPEKVVRYLRTLGIRSVSKIVDLGNWSMVLTGQPLHMYDLDKVAGGKLTVRDDIEEKLLALDGKEYQTVKGDVVICDEKKPCCLGGVMGLKSVAVDEKTTHVGIEAAHFYHAAIRHTSSRLGLISDSSALFVKGVNPYLTAEALNWTLKLVKEFFPEAEIVGLSSFDQTAPFKGSYPFSVAALNKRMGASYAPETVLGILKRLGLSYDGKEVQKSKYRLDLNEQCDLDEEVFRLADQKDISLSLKNLPETAGSLTPSQAKTRKIRSFLLAQGLDEVITYTLLNARLDKELRVFSADPSYKVMHPLTEDHLYVRSDLLSSLANVIQYNLDRKNTDIGFFEISTVDTPKGNHLYLSLGLAGNVAEQGMVKTHPADFYDLKGLFEGLMGLLGLDERRYQLTRSVNPSFHPGRSADARLGKDLLATFGEVSPVSSFAGMYLMEIDLGLALSQKTSKLKVQPLPSFQPIRRDLAFKILDHDLTAGQIVREIKKAGGKYVLKAEPFDVFTKDGSLYMAFALTLYKEDKSFTDTEINSLLNTIILDVTHTLKTELRS
jgi:phenylalanyl-tRNA synthetase beta chain